MDGRPFTKSIASLHQSVLVVDCFRLISYSFGISVHRFPSTLAMTKTNEIPGPPVPVYHNESWKLISQGAEARIWLVPNFITDSTKVTSTDTTSNINITSTVICKERFPKAYRHPTLDETLTRSRTKAEARNLTKCRRGGVSVPLMLGIDLNKVVKAGDGDESGSGGIKSASLFMEYVQGCTVRNYLNVQVQVDPNGSSETDDLAPVSGSTSNSDADAEPPSKKQKLEETSSRSTSKSETGDIQNNHKKIITRVDEYAKKMSYSVGVAIAKMHNCNIIHGDLTTSNIMLRNENPPNTNTESAPNANADTGTKSKIDDWNPDIVLIDFGLSSSSTNTKKTSCHEERAVDLYVLERAFVTTHVGSEDLVGEVMRGYKASCQSSDSVFVRLAQVRLRGRKKESFG